MICSHTAWCESVECRIELGPAYSSGLSGWGEYDSDSPGIRFGAELAMSDAVQVWWSTTVRPASAENEALPYITVFDVGLGLGVSRLIGSELSVAGRAGIASDWFRYDGPTVPSDNAFEQEFGFRVEAGALIGLSEHVALAPCVSYTQLLTQPERLHSITTSCSFVWRFRLPFERSDVFRGEM
jgi:hypothetical protein